MLFLYWLDLFVLITTTERMVNSNTLITQSGRLRLFVCVIFTVCFNCAKVIGVQTRKKNLFLSFYTLNANVLNFEIASQWCCSMRAQLGNEGCALRHSILLFYWEVEFINRSGVNSVWIACMCMSYRLSFHFISFFSPSSDVSMRQNCMCARSKQHNI